MKDSVGKLRHDLIELAEFVQEAAYDGHKSLSPSRIEMMLELSRRLALVADRLDENVVSEAPEPDEKIKSSQVFPASPKSRTIN